ncbi:YceI family protein [Sulfitobacter sabulilitoris]|uniref:YceI family protein n=1 Tax=Sulfitobacter sabulilitoris TaxID=2562655 RepID=A0A5S3PL72_9RHOB|nr:YceI family protein [Sulfitobacter sabulilitoris]TMM55149.1 YceI family protein [Sulfitobacter sabulilitoris]
MRALMPRRAFLLCALAAASPVQAAPRDYVLSPQASQISFVFTLNGSPQVGTAPVASADLRVDPANLAASTADVRADISRARTGLVFATQALKSRDVLDAARYPIVRFVSTSIQLGRKGRISGGATITGRLTLRGVTRPLRLNATLTRPAGTAPDDLSILNIHLTGALSRSAYGASGFADLVADRVDLDIRAQIRARG